MEKCYLIRLSSMGKLFPQVMRETFYNRAVKRAVIMLLQEPASSEALISCDGRVVRNIDRDLAASLVDDWAETAAYA